MDCKGNGGGGGRREGLCENGGQAKEWLKGMDGEWTRDNNLDATLFAVVCIGYVCVWAFCFVVVVVVDTKNSDIIHHPPFFCLLFLPMSVSVLCFLDL